MSNETTDPRTRKSMALLRFLGFYLYCLGVCSTVSNGVVNRGGNNGGSPLTAAAAKVHFDGAIKIYNDNNALQEKYRERTRVLSRRWFFLVANPAYDCVPRP